MILSSSFSLIISYLIKFSNLKINFHSFFIINCHFFIITCFLIFFNFISFIFFDVLTLIFFTFSIFLTRLILLLLFFKKIPFYWSYWISTRKSITSINKTRLLFYPFLIHNFLTPLKYHLTLSYYHLTY